MLAPVSWVPRQCKECFSHSGFSFCRQKSPWRTCRAPQPCQPEHRATVIRLHAVKAHFSNLITHGLLGLTFPQCTGDRHPSVSPLSQAQISWQRQEKLNNLFTAKHSEAKRQRHWQMAVMFWQRSTRSHVQVNFCCEQTAKACYGQGLSKAKPGKWTISCYLCWKNKSFQLLCGSVHVK